MKDLVRLSDELVEGFAKVKGVPASSMNCSNANEANRQLQQH